MLVIPATAMAPYAPFDADILWGERPEPRLRSYAFGAFLLQPERQRLTENGVPVRIGGRALDLLTALAERPGELVSKQELLARVWPHVLVDEANLKANMAQLRRVLGETYAEPRFIATIVGRGYRFVCPVRSSESDFAAHRSI